MCLLEVQPTEVHLKGISRTTTFTINNPNEFLAASYALQFKHHSAQQHPKLSLFPQKGILLCGQSQKIKIKYTGGTAESTLGEFCEQILVRYTFKIEYNRSLMLKKNMKGWQQIPDKMQETLVYVQVGGEKEAIQKYIKEDIIFNQEFNQNNLDISAIQQSGHKSFINEKSFANLQIDSRTKDNWFNHIPSMERDQKSEKTGLELPIEEICPLQYGESRAGNINNSRKQNKSKQYSMQENNQKLRYPMVESKLVKDVKEVDKSFELQMKTVKNEFSSNQEYSSCHTFRESNNRNTQFVILAIIAAFFVALGNNMGRILR